MLSHNAFYLYQLAHKNWYESLAYYQPDVEFLTIARSILPVGWHMERGEVWTNFFPPDQDLPMQGWKIHISATPLNCIQILERVTRICEQENTAFKFLGDKNILELMTNKPIARPSGGKFITIYPLNEAHFHKLLDLLYAELHQFEGPYILSDRRYKDAQVIYYRYGGIKPLSKLNVDGTHGYLLQSPEGDFVPDVRDAYYALPDWVADFQEDDTDSTEESTLANGRYTVLGALTYSIAGGVYLAEDNQTNIKVIIKEARPHIAVDDEQRDAVAKLAREYQILQKLDDTHVTPKPIDFFTDWEHHFLVEEHLEGITLFQYIGQHQPFIAQPAPSEADIAAYFTQIQKIWVNIVAAMQKIHDKGFVFGDVSVNNIIITNIETLDLKFIDFESLWEDGLEQPNKLITAGFSAQENWYERGKHSDIYAIGALMLGTLFPYNSIYALAPTKYEELLDVLAADLGIPPEVKDIIKQSMSPEKSERPSLDTILEKINETQPLAVRETESALIPVETLQDIIQKSTNYILETVDLRRTDRLFPADPAVYFTNPLNVAYGATGVAYALQNILGEISPKLQNKLLSFNLNFDKYPPGLFTGYAGISWVYWDIGLEDVALNLFHNAANHPLLWDCSDLFYGATGYGLTCLKFYTETHDQIWLDKAVTVGEWLLEHHVEDKNGNWYWLNQKDDSGYASGSSGVALFLLYLSILAEESKFLEAGRATLAFDLDHLRRLNDNPLHLAMPRTIKGNFQNAVTGYLVDGGAGIVKVLARYWFITQDDDYLVKLKGVGRDISRKHAVCPGLFKGLAGLGNSLLDMYTFTRQETYLQQANQTARGVLNYKLDYPEGIAFPGDQLYRVSTDFSTGSAGITLFLNRLLKANQGQPADNFEFTLDEVLTSATTPKQPVMQLTSIIN